VRAAIAALGGLRAFRDDRRGGVMVWLALATPPLMALCVLSVDVARVYNLDAELQTGADALARAGAVELDGRDDAISRAQAAVADLVANDRRFSNARTGKVEVQATRFLDALPSSDSNPVTADYETTDANDARYLEVTVRPEQITTLFPPQIAAGLVSVSLSAKSVGGRMAQMCGAAPLFICNPVEDDSSTTLQSALDGDGYRGRQLLLRGKGGGSTYAPGQFGYLEPPGGAGASDMKAFFAEVSPDICYPATGVTLRTGVVSSADQGLNTRFGVYAGSFKNTGSSYPAAANTTSYPRDACFASGGCERTGDGRWDVLTYMAANHGSPASADLGGVTYHFNYVGRTVTPKAPSRYQVYRWEIAKAGGTPPPSDSDRRVMPVAVLNCQAESLSASRIPVASFAKVFLTEPMGSGSNDVIWGELVGSLRWGQDAQARDQVDVRR
jgi:Flp pilus assembly protein TadG